MSENKSSVGEVGNVDGSAKSFLDKEDLRAMVNANQKLMEAQKTYENVGLQCRILELEFNLLKQNLQRKYNLHDNDRIDNITGEIYMTEAAAENVTEDTSNES